MPRTAKALAKLHGMTCGDPERLGSPSYWFKESHGSTLSDRRLEWLIRTTNGRYYCQASIPGSSLRWTPLLPLAQLHVILLTYALTQDFEGCFTKTRRPG